MTRKERNERMRIWRQKQKAKGCCHQCYRNPKLEGSSRCADCVHTDLSPKLRIADRGTASSQESAGHVEALFARAEVEKRRVTWLELSSGRSNS